MQREEFTVVDPPGGLTPDKAKEAREIVAVLNAAKVPRSADAIFMVRACRRLKAKGTSPSEMGIEMVVEIQKGFRGQ